MASALLNQTNSFEPPATDAEFISLCEDFDFIHLILSDIHGHSTVSVFPASCAKSLVTQGTELPLISLANTIDGDLTQISKRPELSRTSFDDVLIRPIAETSRECPWLGNQTSSRILEVLAAPEWLTGGLVDAHPRQIAVSQIQRLHDRGLDILWGIECEFRLFSLKDETTDEPILAHSNLRMNNTHLIRRYEKFYVEINKRFKAIGLRMNFFRTLNECGHVKVSLFSDWGIKVADDALRLKMIVRDVAAECGYKVSFMTKVLHGQMANGFHFRHSIWRRQNGTVDENVLFDRNDVDKLSNFARHWMAGLLRHASATTAISSPTVNCYRRLHTTWGPKYADWGVENGATSLSVKFGGPDDQIIIENRTSSPAVNPYLVIACTIAAGLDGVDEQLDLVPDGSKENGLLPKSLPESLEKLLKNEVMSAALGEQFKEWYAVAKCCEISKLEGSDVTTDRKVDYDKERKVYFASV